MNVSDWHFVAVDCYGWALIQTCVINSTGRTCDTLKGCNLFAGYVTTKAPRLFQRGAMCAYTIVMPNAIKQR